MVVVVVVAVAVRNGVGFFFQETKILIVIFGGSVLEFRERQRRVAGLGEKKIKVES